MKKYITIFLIFFLLFAFAVPCYAQAPDEDWSNYLIIQGYLPRYVESYPHSYFALVPNNDVDLKYTVTTDDSGNVIDIIIVNSTDLKTQVNYFIYTDNSWRGMGGAVIYGPAESVFSDLVFNNIYASTNPVYIYGTDEVFTPPPNLETVTGEALTHFQSQTIQTISILVLCGVGCLGLLISLVILRKVYYRFLNK